MTEEEKSELYAKCVQLKMKLKKLKRGNKLLNVLFVQITSNTMKISINYGGLLWKNYSQLQYCASCSWCDKRIFKVLYKNKDLRTFQSVS